MDSSYLSISDSEDFPITCRSLLQNIVRNFNIEDCANFVLNYQKDSSLDKQTSTHLEHWLERKWQVCLDYYLSSSNPGNARPDPTIQTPHIIDIQLPTSSIKEQLDRIPAFFERKTHRKFQEKSLDLAVLSLLLKEINGELFPEVWRYYILIFNVKNIPPGIYQFYPQAHGLSLIREGSFRDEVVALLCGMSASQTASHLILMSIDVQKAMKCYPYNKALREMYIDSGRMIQKLLIRGVQYNVGGLPSPAMRDSPMCTFLNIDPCECIPIYSLTMGIIPKKECYDCTLAR